MNTAALGAMNVIYYGRGPFIPFNVFKLWPRCWPAMADMNTVLPINFMDGFNSIKDTFMTPHKFYLIQVAKLKRQIVTSL